MKTLKVKLLRSPRFSEEVEKNMVNNDLVPVQVENWDDIEYMNNLAAGETELPDGIYVDVCQSHPKRVEGIYQVENGEGWQLANKVIFS